MFEAMSSSFSTSPGSGVSLTTAFIDQIVGTAILVAVIFALTCVVNNPPLGNTAPLIIGILVVWIVTPVVWLWMAYRIIRGFVDLNNNRPMPV